jgi:Phage integrase family
MIQHRDDTRSKRSPPFEERSQGARGTLPLTGDVAARFEAGTDRSFGGCRSQHPIDRQGGWGPAADCQPLAASMVTAMIIARNTGQRAKDIREYPWAKYDGERVTVRQSKGNKWITIPASAELKAHLDALDHRGETVLSTERGKMFSKRWFNECFREDADAVGAEIDGRKLNFHDMRGTVATNLASAGCTPFEIASVIGWSLDKCQKIVDAYIATTGEMADAAFAKLEARKVEQARLAAIRTNEAMKTAANSNEPPSAPAAPHNIVRLPRG